MNFAKFLRTPFYIEHLWWLLLILHANHSNGMLFDSYDFANMMDSCKLTQLCTSNLFQKQTTEVLCKKGVLKNFTNFKVKEMCQSLFFHETACLRPATLLKKRLQPPTQLFSGKFCKNFRSTFFYYLKKFENSNGSFMCLG